MNQSPQFNTRRSLWFGALALAVFVAAWAADPFVHQAVKQWPATERQVFEIISVWGKADAALLIGTLMTLAGLGMLLVTQPYWRKWYARTLLSVGWLVLMAVAIPGLIVQIVKRVIGRARPETLEPQNHLFFNWWTGDYRFHSFPSGHSVTAFALAVVLSHLLPARWRWPVYAVATAIAVSRMAVGAHYLTDVLAGAALGIASGHLVLLWFARRDGVVSRTPDGTSTNRMGRLFRRMVGSALARF